MYNHPRYTQRTVEWGHWGITFLDVQPDRTKNYGVIVASLGFAVGSRGPIDAGPVRAEYKRICEAWCSDGSLPAQAKPI